MSKATHQLKQSVEIVDYDPRWREIFAAEREVLLDRAGRYFVAFEHIGSTAIPGQRAKPVIDMMAAVRQLDALDTFLPELETLGYHLFETGMRDRYFLRKQDTSSGQTFHLHIVEVSSWDERNEHLMRDYLLEHPKEVEAYGELKNNLAQTYSEDSVTYTEAKTEFMQGIVDKARDRLGLPRVDVWED